MEENSEQVIVLDYDDSENDPQHASSGLPLVNVA